MVVVAEEIDAPVSIIEQTEIEQMKLWPKTLGRMEHLFDFSLGDVFFFKNESSPSSIGSHHSRTQSTVADNARARNRTGWVYENCAVSIRKFPPDPFAKHAGVIQRLYGSSTSTKKHPEQHHPPKLPVGIA